MIELQNLSLDRRAFLQAAGASAALLLGACRRDAPAAATPGRARGPFDVLLELDSDGTATIWIDKSEMGQGVMTALPMLVAEELELPFERVRARTRIAEGALTMGTAASQSVRSGYEPLRHAGAAARQMLLAVGARRLGVDTAQCEARRGQVVHLESGRLLEYAALVAEAAQEPVPSAVALKPPDAFRVIGTRPPRIDVAAKVTGQATYGLDVPVPDRLVAFVRAAPPAGGALVSMDAAAAQALPDVVDVVTLPDAVAVVARHTYAADRGMRALAPRFEAGDFDSECYREELVRALDEPGIPIHTAGPAPTAGQRRISADYQVPFVAHLALEPANCTARVDAAGCELWFPTQAQAQTRIDVSNELALPPEQVRVHTPYLGGGFGGRLDTRIAVQAARLARALGRPVQAVVSRSEDLAQDSLRPAYAARLSAELDAEGRPRDWQLRLAGAAFQAQGSPAWLQQSIGAIQRRVGALPIPSWVPWSLRKHARWVSDPRDAVALEGAEPLAYGLPQRTEFCRIPAPVRLGWWRSVGHAHNAFFAESFIDEIAHATGQDPIVLRRKMLAARPRTLAVLDRALALSERTPERSDRGRGVAVWECFGSVVAAVAEVSDAGGVPRAHHLWAAIDCGRAVHPGIVEAQLEGALGFGASAALREQVTIRAGIVAERGFMDLRPLSLAEAPAIEVAWLASELPPGGVGEAGTPVAAPALANAWFALTGERRRSLPLALETPREG